MKKTAGVTLIEMLIVLAILAIIATLTAPSLGLIVEKNAIRSVAESIKLDLQWTRTEAIKRSQDLTVSVNKVGGCYGISTQQPLTNPITEQCVCTDCDIKTVNALRDHNNLKFLMQPDENPVQTHYFKFMRGTATAGSLCIQSQNNLQLKVIVSTLGRIRIEETCS
ncbi:MAG: prepilin-type N-terminal cleavage/methylation domain-containing protein [Methylococcales bacterium]|jgi:type IV fimbrial biogenesis protein FimT|nr:prepilin-type N-terminal cleavage/methylation domain-containing protein [Methylococcales bacterium]MBT3816015.1 prepilin-type N-terminal cleavage/methylation domain-containing protein [Methylococcales bacterium]MBT4032963.1 prepilin-type N-terminal cleavage/methylation domain-containing protein [Methylococcales bacterium]MBT4348818.1 prepilin-type N-terminal cleavage/methylation domain-containing protein [Methylococcales bacterium]MBT4598746.1 prepilin-type N-terminal cleavage/methylation do